VLTAQLFWTVLPAAFRENDSGDYRSFYEPVARSIMAGRGLMTPAGSAAIDYPPGHPIILAAVLGVAHATGLPESDALRIFLLACAGFSAVLLFVSAGQVWEPRRALVAGIAWIVYPPALWLTKQPYSEGPYLVVLYGGACIFLKALFHSEGRTCLSFLSGLLAGVAALIRPAAIGFGLVLALLLWLASRVLPAGHRWTLIALLLAGNAAAVLPWECWVWYRTGQLLPLSSGGVRGVLDGLTFAVIPKSFRQTEALPSDVHELMRSIEARQDTIKSAGDLVSVVSRTFLARPWPVLKLVAMKAARSWYATDSGRFQIPILAIQVVTMGLVLLSTRAAWTSGGLQRLLVCGVWVVIAYFWGMTVLVLSIARYMVPAIGLAFLLLPALLLRAPRSSL